MLWQDIVELKRQELAAKEQQNSTRLQQRNERMQKLAEEQRKSVTYVSCNLITAFVTVQGCLPLHIFRNHYWNWPQIMVVRKLLQYYGNKSISDFRLVYTSKN